MNNESYFNLLQFISEHVTKLSSYLQVLHVYAENEMTFNDKIGNIYEILDLAVKEIDIITQQVWHNSVIPNLVRDLAGSQVTTLN